MRILNAIVLVVFLTGCGEKGKLVVNPNGTLERKIEKQKTEPSNNLRFIGRIPVERRENEIQVFCDPANLKVIYVFQGSRDSNSSTPIAITSQPSNLPDCGK